MKKKAAVILSGCGNKDGSEITEVVSLMISLSQLNTEVTYFAPDIEFEALNFLTNEPLNQKRQILIEAARITRSDINDLETLVTKDFDALFLPGGFGVAKYLSTWSTQGARCEVLPTLSQVINEFHQMSRPIGAICIAPTLLARVLGDKGVTITLGPQSDLDKEIKNTGAHIESCPVEDYISDRLHKIVTTPAYMVEEASPSQVFLGISRMAKEVMEMA